MPSSLAVKILCVLLAFGTISLLFYDYIQTKEMYRVKQTELLSLSTHLQEQNEAIKKLKIDVEKYKNKKPKIVKQIVTKYEEVQVKDETCEAELESISQLTKLFFNREGENAKSSE